MNRSDCLELDRQDPLADHRQRFALPEGVVYLDGNSLGARPRAAADVARRVVEDEWGEGLIRSWNDAGWIDLPRRLGARLAPLIGARAEEVIIADSTSINLFKLAAAALRLQQQDRPGRRVILSEPGNFPTDLYMLQGLCDFMAGEPELITEPAETLIERIDETTALVVLTQVHYKSGRIHDMAAITRRAHDCGALVVWDLSHSAGALDVDLNGCDADFAIGCGYKYLNGGPGAPAFLFAAERHLARLRQPLSGWFGHEAPFAMDDDYRPAPDNRRLLTGTTSVVATSLLEAGLATFDDTSMSELRAKSVRLTELFIKLVEARCAAHGLQLVSPRDPTERGSQVAFAHPEGYAIVQALIDAGVIGDFRAPDILRFGFAPLYIGYADVWDAVERLKTILDERRWDDARFKARGAIT